MVRRWLRWVAIILLYTFCRTGGCILIPYLAQTSLSGALRLNTKQMFHRLCHDKGDRPVSAISVLTPIMPRAAACCRSFSQPANELSTLQCFQGEPGQMMPPLVSDTYLCEMQLLTMMIPEITEVADSRGYRIFLWECVSRMSPAEI